MAQATDPTAAQASCPLCNTEGGEVIARNARLRIVRTDEGDFPAFYRVVWNAHVCEFSDLSREDRMHCMDVVAALEQALRDHLRPDKVNVASLGNMVPHLHWHVMARFVWDSHFPAPVWAAARRTPDSESSRRVIAARAVLHQAIVRALPAVAEPGVQP
jgi:diadenosine tetraphosphate (Ap4A) HIT family hydrolase